MDKANLLFWEVVLSGKFPERYLGKYYQYIDGAGFVWDKELLLKQDNQVLINILKECENAQ